MTDVVTTGEKTTYESGAVRDNRAGKGRYDLISCAALQALARQRSACHDVPWVKRTWSAIALLCVWGQTRSRAALENSMSYMQQAARERGMGILAPLAKRLEDGAKVYSDRNWEKGMPLSQFYDSALRHLDQLLSGDGAEDHLGAAMFNVMALLDHELRLAAGEDMAADVDDWPVKRTSAED